jgi:hypothetical protein
MSKIDKGLKDKEVLLEAGNKKLVLSREISDEVVQLFDEVLWGTGDNQYQHKDSRRRLELLDNPNFVELLYDNQRAAMCLFINRKVRTGDLTHNYFAVRYLFAVPEYRSKNLTARYSIETMRIMQDRQTTPTLFVGVVEHKNRQSYRLVSSLGYVPYCTIKTVGISRYFPRRSKNVKLVESTEEQQVVKSALEEFYRDYSFVHFDSVFKEPYYVYVKDGRAVAGVQFQKAHWVVKNVGGKWLKMAFKVVPYIPVLRNIFNPDHFEFLGLDGIFFEPGCEREFLKLVSHLLKENDLNSALFWSDEKSPLYRQLLKTGKLGLLNRFTTEGDSSMMVKSDGIPEDEISELKSRPAYQSAFDYL